MDVLFRFRKDLEKRRHSVCDSEDSFFYIFEELRDIITDSIIIDLLSFNTSDHAAESVVKTIRQDGPRLFCILAIMGQVNQIKNFLAHDVLDNRLPIRDETELEEIAPSLGHHFFTKYQWEFFPFMFRKDRGHLILSQNITLPLTSNEELAEGSGGIVSIMKIPALTQDFYDLDQKDICLVRKQIKASGPRAQTQEIFQSELDCLELYRMLRHPNIIPLLGSFTQNGQHNLLFPRYACNLDAFLERDRVDAFVNNATFTSAVADLASALQHVHQANWRSRMRPKLHTKYGYHHDFRPANILVTGATFILADFGLAQFASGPPVTTWNENIGHYIAPECMDESFTPQSVGFTYDIWAFGCFLCEIATYMALGCSGVKQFESERKTNTYYDTKYKNSYFFDGKTSSLKSKVTDWLQKLLDQAQDGTVVSFVSLSKKMLQFSPQDRSDMMAHSIRLEFIHAKCLFHSATSSFTRVLGNSQFTASSHLREKIEIELSRLQAFGDCHHMYDHTTVDCIQFKDESYRIKAKRCLTSLYTNRYLSKADLVKHIHREATTNTNPDGTNQLESSELIDQSFRIDIEELCEAVTDKILFDDLFRKRVFGPSPSEDRLQVLEECGKEEPDFYANIGLQAKLQRLDQALFHGTRTTTLEEDNLILDWSDVSGELSTFSRYHNIAMYNCGSNGKIKRKALIEWVFISQFPESESEDDRIEKLLGLASLLHLKKPPRFCTLDCLGFLPPKPDSPYDSGYGFVYPLPADEGMAESIVPKSLRSLLNDRKFPITLGEKFRAAKDLAHSIFQLHSRNWLHKNIRSDNIIFCGYDTKNEKKGVTFEIDSGPYVIGFHHGRPDRDVFCSDIPSSEVDPETLLYQHPNYKPGENRFQKSFDCYSLAVVLIELAHWQPAEQLRSKHDKGKSLISEPLLDVFDKRYSRSMAQSMGNAYMEATRACLSGSREIGAASALDSSDISYFYTQVIQRLDACYVG